MEGTPQSLILTKYPIPIFAVTDLVLSFLSLGPSPTFVPLVLLLATLRLHGLRTAFRSTRVLELISSWLVVTLGASMAHYSSAMNGLSSPSQSFIAVAVMSAMTYVCAIVAFYLDICFNRHLPTTWAQLTFFPVVWVLTWSVVSHISPVGRLLNWSPVSTTHPYSWLLPYTGPLGIDWAVAACAVLCSECAAMWLMGSDEEEQLVHPPTSKVPSKRRSRDLLMLGVLLAALALPTSLFTTLPMHVDTSFDTSPLGVACVLPPIRKGVHPTLSDFIAETRRVAPLAKVVLWPESAVEFHSQEEREIAFENLRRGNGIQQSLVGVAFEEFVPEDPSNPSGSRMKRNGLALVHSNQKRGEEIVQYYKRNLVPFTESFSTIPSTDAPNIYTLELPPPKWTTKSEWSSAPNYTRPIPITSSICLDLAFPSAFSSLDSRPALILAPARTWDPTIGLAMWEQAKLRANEIGSMVLWCDGGATGVSGIGGGGISEIMQVGAESWTRTIGLQFPFDQRRTVYATIGEMGVLVFLVAIMGGRSVASHLSALPGRHALLGIVPVLRRLIPGRRANQQNLIDFSGPGERQSLLG